MHQGAGEVLESDAEASHSAGLLWDCAQHWCAAAESQHALRVLISGARHFLAIGATEHAIDASERWEIHRPAPDFAAIKVRQQATWASGDFAIVGTTLQIVGELLAEAADVRADERVLEEVHHQDHQELRAAFCLFRRRRLQVRQRRADDYAECTAG